MINEKEMQEKLAYLQDIDVIKIIEEMLSAAREEGIAFAEAKIIHCKDCRYGIPVHGKIISPKDPIKCTVDPLEHKSYLNDPEDFCSFGQKKD